MALRKHVNPKSILNPNTGFGSDPDAYGGRFVNKDGSYNIVRKGVRFQHRISIFQKMITMPLWKFGSFVLIFFIALNIVFAIIYYFLGKGEFTKTAHYADTLLYLVHLFFFSVQALTTVTVDFKQVAPIGFWASFVSSFEALSGLVVFAILTGLVYGRFARPRSFLVFSHNALIAPYKDMTALMFRMVGYKERHDLINVDIRVNFGLTVEANGKPGYKFYILDLERNHIDSLNMNWTIVHPIDQKSPFQNLTKEDLEHGQAEIVVQITGFDQVYSTTIVQRTSYYYNEIIYGAKFVSMYYESDDDMTTILELNKLNEYERVPLPG
ncbi:MAG: ion channel [Chitinophagaceae bacterium]